MSMSLDQFVGSEYERLARFRAYWLNNNARNPDMFPMEMAAGNEGVWQEMLQDFEESSGLTEGRRGKNLITALVFMLAGILMLTFADQAFAAWTVFSVPAPKVEPHEIATVVFAVSGDEDMARILGPIARGSPEFWFDEGATENRFDSPEDLREARARGESYLEIYSVTGDFLTRFRGRLTEENWNSVKQKALNALQARQFSAGLIH